MESALSTDIQYLRGIGEKRAKLFASLGIHTVEELLFFFPRAYEDRKTIYSLADAPLDKKICVKVTILNDISERKTHSGQLLSTTLCRDKTDYLGVVFFNNKYISKTVHLNDEVYLYGKITLNSATGTKEMLSPSCRKADGKVPSYEGVYPQTQGLTSAVISKAVATALKEYKKYIPESLPEELIKKYKLKSITEALSLIHFPQSEEDIRQARRRLIFEELLVLRLGIAIGGKSRFEKTDCIITRDYSSEFEKHLPFTLTNGQKSAISQCISDMGRGVPMSRLLQGDVGSGKTAVAASLIYTAVKNGFQCVLMAPTEVLANQHYETFAKFFDGTDISVALLTGSLGAKTKRIIKSGTASGDVQLLIGTHAVITDDVSFDNLGLVITDEQHRFGVRQRAALRCKGNNVNMLVMSATPIPRTLSLIIYGDLDISVLNEKPLGRLPVKTYRVPTSYRKRIYSFIKKEAQAGRRSYIVCPRVEEDESFTSSRVAAETYIENLRKGELKDLRLGLLHGKMKPKEKDVVMQAFASGEIDVLVCTVVIEVGIDVPEASIIVIENAEFFGLSQLHQLRGRVGRGKEQSHCILVSDAQNEEATERLGIMCATSDGFRIAEEDLKLRGPGDFFGSRQSGLPLLRLADLMTDTAILEAAGAEAQKILSQDTRLSDPRNSVLRKKVSELFADIS